MEIETLEDTVVAAVPGVEPGVFAVTGLEFPGALPGVLGTLVPVVAGFAGVTAALVVTATATAPEVIKLFTAASNLRTN